MENKITLEEAKDLYSKNEGIREFLESKFSKEELTKTKESIEQKFLRVWEDNILSQCDSVRFLDSAGYPSKTPTSRVEVLDKGGMWLLDYSYSPKNFWFSFDRVHNILEKEISSDMKIIQGLISTWVKGTLGIEGAKPQSSLHQIRQMVKGTLGIEGAKPTIRAA